MASFDLLVATALLLWNFWPLMFLAALTGAVERGLRRRGSLVQAGKQVLQRLSLFWLIWLALRGFLAYTRSPLNPIVPELFFWVTGVALVFLWAVRMFIDRYNPPQHLQFVRGLSDLQRLSPEEFEQVVAETYRAFGHQVKVVGASGDHGIDLVVRAPNGEKRVVQCKRWKSKVGEPVIRDLYGAMQHEGAVEAAVVTAGSFTPQALAWAKGKPIRLYDGESFLKELRRAQMRTERKT